MNNNFLIERVRKSLIVQLFFPVLLLAVFSCTLIKTPTDNFFNPRPLNYKSSYDNFYNQSLPHVTVSVPILEYSGLDYISNGRICGSYYYTLVDELCQFYLLSHDGNAVPPRQITQVALRGRLVKLDNLEYEALIKNMAAQLNWSPEALESVSVSYAISTIPYPFYINYLFYIILYGGLIIALADIICLLINIYKPLRAPAFSYLGTLDNRRKLFPGIQAELRLSTALKGPGIFVTPRYFVSTNPFNTVVIPLELLAQVYYKIRKPKIGSCFFSRTCILYVTIADGKTLEFPKYKKEEIHHILSCFKHSPNLSEKLREHWRERA